MDYRYFFMNNKNYYDELSTMSLMLCNTLEHNENSGNGDLANLTTLFRRIGLKKWNDETEVEIKIAKYGTNGEVKYVVGENEIEYTHNYTEKTISKKVKLIVVKSIEAGKDNIEKIGNNNLNQHELFEGLAKAIYDKEFKGQEFCYWVTGYNTGGAVANVLAAKMIDKGLYYVPKGGIGTSSNAYITFEHGQKSTQTEHSRVITNVYAYTFGAPYTIYNGKEIKEEVNTIADKYASIFNVVSNADIYAYIMPHLYKWGRYGVTCCKVQEKYKNLTYEKNVKINIESKLNNIFSSYDNNEEFKKNYYDNKYFKPSIILINNSNGHADLLKSILYYFLTNIDIPNTLVNDIKDNDGLKNGYLSLIDCLNKNRNIITRNRDESIYFELSKKILPEDISFVVSTEDNGFKRKPGLYDRYPNFHALSPHNIDINNPVPSIFQDAEVWSQFRYGTQYTENENDTITHPDDVDKEESERRKIVKYNDDFYPYGTFWESGCGAAAPAIVLSYIFDKQITPMDVRDKLENDTNDYRPYLAGKTHEELAALPKNKRVNGTNHDSERRIAELYGLSCEHFTQNTKDKGKEYDASIKVTKHLLRGNPVIALCKNGVFTFGGHFIVIAGIDNDQVNDLKRQKGVATLSEPEKTIRWNQVIDNLKYEDLKDLRIYVLDPRYRHEERPTKKTQEKEATITTAWSIETFKYGGNGNVDEFWVYTKNNTTNTNNIVESELFDFNKTKYPDDYKEYFDPQAPGDADRDCNSGMTDKKIGFFGKMRQYWKERLGIAGN